MVQESTGSVPSVRKAALDTLIQIMEKNVFCDKAMHDVLDRSSWDRKNRSFYQRLVSGTVERAVELDYILNLYSKVPVEKMKPVIRNILRMSLYQILYMERIPVSAVCNEAVKLTEKRRMYSLKGFVNGVLRTILRERDKISYPEERVPALCVRYSMPEWLVKRWLEEYGDERTEALLGTFLEEKGYLTVRRQKSLVSSEEIEDSFRKDGVSFFKGVLLPYAYRIRNYTLLERLEAFQKGFFFVQDESSMLPGEVSGVKKGDFVIDLCAAPGGKAMHIADFLEGTGRVIACDLKEEKLALLKENVKRLQLSNVEVMQNDAQVFREAWKEKADVVIADLPCSGLGVIGKKCDIKYKTKKEDIFALSAIQKEILKAAVQYVKPGGHLVYSTCTIAKEENEENVFWIEKNLPLRRISFEEALPEKLKGRTGEQGFLQVMPNETGTDGFFVSLFEKYSPNVEKRKGCMR